MSPAASSRSTCTTTRRYTAAMCCSRSTRAPSRSPSQDAEAQLAAARLRVRRLEAAYRQRQADESAAREHHCLSARTTSTARRKLAADGITSQAQFDQAAHDLDVAHQGLIAATPADRQRARRARRRHRRADRQPPGRARRRKPRSIAPNSTFPTPPCRRRWTASSPRSSSCRSATTSMRWSPLFALVSDHDMWVEANFKETDLTYMRPGQKATFTVDAYPGPELHRQGRRAPAPAPARASRCCRRRTPRATG